MNESLTNARIRAEIAAYHKTRGVHPIFLGAQFLCAPDAPLLYYVFGLAAQLTALAPMYVQPERPINVMLVGPTDSEKVCAEQKLYESTPATAAKFVHNTPLKSVEDHIRRGAIRPIQVRFNLGPPQVPADLRTAPTTTPLAVHYSERCSISTQRSAIHGVYAISPGTESTYVTEWDWVAYGASERSSSPPLPTKFTLWWEALLSTLTRMQWEPLDESACSDSSWRMRLMLRVSQLSRTDVPPDHLAHEAFAKLMIGWHTAGLAEITPKGE